MPRQNQWDTRSYPWQRRGEFLRSGWGPSIQSGTRANAFTLPLTAIPGHGANAELYAPNTFPKRFQSRCCFPGGRQNIGCAATAWIVVLPDGLSRLVINCPQSAAIGSRANLHRPISFRMRICIRQIKDAEGLGCTHVEQSGLGIEARRGPVCRATRIR